MTGQPTEVVIRVQLEVVPVQPTATPDAAGPLLYRVQEAAQMMAISQSTLTELIARGEVESLKVGAARRIARTAIEDYIARRAGETDG